MHGLAERGLTGITLGRLVAAWRRGAPLPPAPVVLTFDDGFANFLDAGAAVLTDLGFGATVFAVAGYLGGDNGWPGQAPDVPRLPLMGPGDLRQLAGHGFEVGAHTISHPPLTHLSAAESEREILGSQRMLEDLSGTAVTTFAYPYGSADAAIRETIRTAYLAACGVRLAVARRSGDLFQLPRIDMYYFRGPRTSRLLGTRRGHAYLRLRAFARRLRAATLTRKRAPGNRR